MSDQKRGCIGCLVLIVLTVVFATVCTAVGVSTTTEEKAEATAEAEADRRKGFHCLSRWDGNHDGLEKLVKAQLNDPGSMETLQTFISPVNSEGNHRIRMEFTALNAFGGRVRNTAVGWVNNKTCTATLTDIHAE